MEFEAIGKIDVGVIVFYSICLITIGVISARRVKDSSGFLVGNRMFGWFSTLCTQGASMKGAAAFVGYGGGASKSGVGVLFGSQCYNIGGFVALMLGFVKKLRKACDVFDIRSIGDVFFFRYNNRLLKIYVGCVAMWLVIATLASQLSAIGSMIYIFSGGKISFVHGIYIGIAISMAYTAMGGIVAVVYTDVFQWFIMTPLVFIIMPAIFIMNGATPANVHAALPEAFFQLKPSIWWIGLLISGLLTSAVDLTYLTRYISARSEKAAIRGSLLGFLYTTLWAGVIVYLGLAAAYLLGVDNEIQRESVFYVVVAKYFPVGLIGVFAAGLFATTMSTIDSYLHVGVQATLVDILGAFFAKIDENRKVLYCRVLTVVISSLAVLLVLKMKFILSIFYLGWTVYASAMFVPFIACLFSRKASEKAIFLSMTFGIAGSLIAHFSGLSLAVIWGVSSSFVGLFLGIILKGNTGKLLPGFEEPRTKEENIDTLGIVFTLIGGLAISVGIARWYDLVYLIVGVIFVLVGIKIIEKGFKDQNELA